MILTDTTDNNDKHGRAARLPVNREGVVIDRTTKPQLCCHEDGDHEKRVLSLALPWAVIVVVGAVGAAVAVSQDPGCLGSRISSTSTSLSMAPAGGGIEEDPFRGRERFLGDYKDYDPYAHIGYLGEKPIFVSSNKDASANGIQQPPPQQIPTTVSYDPYAHVHSDTKLGASPVVVESNGHAAQDGKPFRVSHDGGSRMPGDPKKFKPVFNEAHKPLFPLDSSDHWGFFFACLGLMVAAGGGIGGGGILVPIFILVMGFSPKHAIPLSNVTVLGGAVSNTILNVRKRHPLADRPLVDWDLILVMEPLTIAGALIGAFLNKVLPELLLTILLVLLLSATAWESLGKAIKLYKKETIELQKKAGIRPDGTKASELSLLTARGMKYHVAGEDDSDSEDDENDEEENEKKKSETADEEQPPPKRSDPDSNVQKKEETDDIDKERFAAAAAQRAIDDELALILEEERTVPQTNLYILYTMFIVVLAVNILKGGGAFRSPLGIKCGSASFWLANGFMLCWILAVSFYVRTLLVHKWEQKARVGFPYVEGDIQWNARATIVYPIACCAAGFFAGMFGVGGGIVKGPLMLAMGVHPAVASASSACMILFTAFTATTSFVVFGLLIPDYALVSFVTGFLATWVGQVGLSYLMKKNQRNSYIAFSIGSVVLLSAILMTIQSLLSMAAGEKHHSGGICGKGT